MGSVQAYSETRSRQSLVERLSDARRRTDELFDIVRRDSLHDRPIPERHRIIFYIGHLETFDWNLLRERVLGLKSFHPEFDRLFAFGIDPVGGGLPDDQPSDWPEVEEVKRYANQIRERLDASLAGYEDFDEAGAGDGFSLATLMNVAIEHRLMHAETLTYMLHQLLHDRKIAPYAPAEIASAPLIPQVIHIPAGRVTLGLSRTKKVFGWDNEFDAYQTEVPQFVIDRYKVTNLEYLDFMRADGYETQAFWTAEDWVWKTSLQISHPVFWKRSADGWLYRTMFDEVPLPKEWPVYVSHAEAHAYANWAGKRLPSEEEWHRAAFGGEEDERAYPWGNETPHASLGNFDFARWNPIAVNAFPGGESAFGVADLVGNGWEWTSTKFGPLPGFTPFPFYRGYSADFFDGKHFVMKGGSARTAASMLRRSFRNWFQPHYQYVYAGFRCASS